MEVASQEKKKSRKEIRRHLKVVVVDYCLKYYLHLKEKVVEKGETNREKLEWIRLQDVLLYFHFIGKNARSPYIFSFDWHDCKMLFHIFTFLSRL